MLDFELLKKEFEEAINTVAGTQVNFWVPVTGENLLRILPPSPSEPTKLFYKKVYVHYRVEGLGMVFCLALNYGEHCPICNLVSQLRRLNTVDSINLAKRYLPVERYLMNVVPLNEGLNIRQWLAPKTVRLQLLKVVLDPDYGDITDLTTGRNVVVERLERGGTGFVDYIIRVKPDRRPLEGVTEDMIPSFGTVLNSFRRSQDEIKLAMFGSLDEVDVEEYVNRLSKIKEEPTKIEATQERPPEVEQKVEKKLDLGDVDINMLMQEVAKLLKG